MTHILILTLISRNSTGMSATISSIEFGSLKAAEFAREQWAGPLQHQSSWWYATAVVVPKG